MTAEASPPAPTPAPTHWQLVRRTVARAWSRPMVRRVVAVLGGAALAWSCSYWPEGPLREACATLVRLLSSGVAG